MEAIENATRENVRVHAPLPPEAMDARIRELEREWDIERTLEANASTLALTGAILGTTVNRRWFWLTGGVLTFLFQHATSGWCPPLPILRKLGVRTQSEIDQEKFALKAVRGDFRDRAIDRPGPEVAIDAVSSGDASEGKAERPEADRVRRYTAGARLRRIDSEMRRRVARYGDQPRPVITARIVELQREWSIERYLQINVAATGLTTAALAVTRDRRWGYATCAALGLFLFHAVEGFDAPLPFLRRQGLRSRAEIDLEIYALKILRGDFAQLEAGGDRVEAALEAVGA